MSDLLTPASEMPADDMAIAEARTRRRDELLSELAQAINSTSTENASNTPDFILANFAAACLDAFAEASVAREAWYGKSLSIDGKTSDIAALEARTPANDPELDSTDFAHPAWWRGHHQTTEMFCRHVQAILDGRDVKDESVVPEPWHTIRQRLLALVDQPAPATDVDALLAEAEDEAPVAGSFRDLIQRLATALRESRTREQAEPYRRALEQRLICSNLPLLTGNADADLMRFVFHEQEIAGYFCGQLEKDLAAAIARAEKAEAEQQTAYAAGERVGYHNACSEKNLALQKANADLAAARAELGALGKKAAEAVEVAYKSGITDTSSVPGPKIIEQMWQDSTARRAALAIRVVKEAQ